ncbi:MAG: alpha-amylase family glycosyl hydrolase [Myxococcota bacterium]
MVAVGKFAELRNQCFLSNDGEGQACALLPPKDRGEVASRWKAFLLSSTAVTAPPAQARILGLSSDATRGLTNLRWSKPGDAITFEMKVDPKGGDAKAIVGEVWTNADHNGDPDDYRPLAMERSTKDGQVRFTAKLPIENIGNYRAVGRISVDGGKTWKWASEFGVPDLRFRTRVTAHEALNERIVHVGIANASPEDWRFSTFADLTSGEYGKYTLEGLASEGINAIRLQPPFRSDPWDKRHPYDTAGSPYAATDFFAIDPRASKDATGVPAWDRDKAMKLANAEFRAFVDKAHSLGIKVILDIALNHTGHNFTFRDYFEDKAAGERVVRNNFSQIALNSEQLAVITDRLNKTDVSQFAEVLYPEMYASKFRDRNGAHNVGDTIGGGNGEWADTKQLNHGVFNYGCDEARLPVNDKVVDWFARILKFWVNDMGVDGFRLDHATNLPITFYERALNQVQASAKKPIAIIGEDFNQHDKLGPYVDALESGWYRVFVDAMKSLRADIIKDALSGGYFNETLRLGNHDEHRIIQDFGGDMMGATRFTATMELLGGWFTSLMGDELGESKQFEFKHTGAVPPVLWQARLQTLPSDNLKMKRWVDQAGKLKTSVDALKTARREFLETKSGAASYDILAVARHADASAQTVLLFTNFSNNGDRSNTFQLDPVTVSRIDPEANYQVRNLMAEDGGKKGLWPEPKKGAELLSDGVYVKLSPYQIQALLLEKVA